MLTLIKIPEHLFDSRAVSSNKVINIFLIPYVLNKVSHLLLRLFKHLVTVSSTLTGSTSQ